MLFIFVAVKYISVTTIIWYYGILL